MNLTHWRRSHDFSPFDYHCAVLIAPGRLAVIAHDAAEVKS